MDKNDNSKELTLEIVQKIIICLRNVYLSTSKEIDKFSGWILAGTAASMALVISNSLSIKQGFGVEPASLLGFLLASVVFGIISKVLFILGDCKFRILKELEDSIHQVIDEHKDAFENKRLEIGDEFHKQLLAIYPERTHYLFDKKNDDNEVEHIKETKSYLATIGGQLIACIMQIISILVMLLVIVFS
ncbi:hypothetical protein D8Y20_13365 [Mariprofundus sp. EBB-1]|uniref:hypothetical protein n=1 Tax=Mariprofundus sp. EBB-1 TaxID=2650971 RepID=UPI000EF25078|nr:hypothetical protein [Mariprofundus sp. EBB-1]RLL49119.1 hypothetical protein D8Y20_13365 [Mariprofundus sp. EBB-1]